jgi:anthranilate synthase component 1
MRKTATKPASDPIAPLRAAQAEGYTLFPVWREIMADCETPVSAYRKLARGPYTFLLESVEGGERLARYSFIGIAPERVLRIRGNSAEWLHLAGERAGECETLPCDDPLELIATELGRERVAPVAGPGLPGATLPRFMGGAVGYLGYEMVAHFERIPLPERDPLGLPDAMQIFTDTLLIFDHVTHRARLLTHARLAGDLAANLAAAEVRLAGIARDLAETPLAHTAFALTENVAPSEKIDAAERQRYLVGVAQAKEAIVAGDAFQIVLSRRTQRATNADPFSIYRALRGLNPSPYLFYLDCGDFQIAGASPEMLVRVEEREVALHPIAGTRPRGTTSGADKAMEAELRYDPKEQAEHVMLVDLGRNDVGRIAQPGSVRVTQMMDVERYSHVMHLVSHITGALRSELTSFDAVRAAFPAGTLSGAPKVRAMELISQIEGERRGVYGGGVGYFSRTGNLDMAIAIRTLVMKDGMAYAQAGAGIVADSDPASEFDETQRKAAALWRAVAMAENKVEDGEKKDETRRTRRKRRTRGGEMP